MRFLTTEDNIKWCRAGRLLYCNVKGMNVFLYGQHKAVKILWRFYWLK